MAWKIFQPERNVIRINIPESYLNNTDTSRFSLYPVAVERKKTDDSILVLFPVSERRASLFVYDSLNYQWLMRGDKRARPLLQTQGLRERTGKPTLNLSRLKNGSYFAHLTSCNYGGFFEIQLHQISDSLTIVH
ncbi:MAG: hypothetical protein ACRCYO_18670 [Bacteroidia bacterium]